jgi:hypothetical protein
VVGAVVLTLVLSIFFILLLELYQRRPKAGTPSSLA